MKKQRGARCGRRKYAAWILFCLLWTPLRGMAETPEATLDCQMLEKSKTVSIDWEVALGDGLSFRIDGYEIGDTFEYSPSGGFSSVVLSAREGYCLFCLYVSAESDTAQSVNTTAFLGMELIVNGAAPIAARGSFFQTIQKNSARSPFGIASRATVAGFLLFALPEDVVAPGVPLTATLSYEENVYSCPLGPETADGEGSAGNAAPEAPLAAPVP